MDKKNKDNWQEKIIELRRAAEKMVVLSSEDLEALSPEETRKRLHELQVHQIELQLQNEELRRAQLALDATRARYFDLYDLAPVGYVTLSEKGLILEANLTAAALLGVARNVLVQRSIAHFIFPEDQDTYYLCRKNLIETGRAQVCEVQLLKKDGTRFWARIETVLAEGEDEKPQQRVIIIDITEKKALAEAAMAAEKLARQRADTLLSLYSAAPQLTDQELYELALDKAVQITASEHGIFHIISDDQKTILLTTRNNAALKGCSAPTDIHYPTDDAGNLANFERLKSPVVYNDFSIYPGQKGFPKGNSPIGRFMGVPVMENGEVKLIFGVANKREDYNDADIAQLQLAGNELYKIIRQRRSDKALKEMADKATAANEAKSRFLATMSHDLRTPLNAVIGFSELLLIEPASKDLGSNQKESIKIIADAGRHLLNIVTGLLNLSAIESGRIILKKETIDLKTMLEDISKQYVLLAGQKGIKWCCDVNLTKPVLADRHRILEVLNNLVSNALKFTQPGGSITLGAWESKDEVTIFVKDTGTGIGKEDLERIFLPFEQGECPGVYKQGKSLGLGLAICRKFVDLHGGKLVVESATGEGSCFTVILPNTAEV